MRSANIVEDDRLSRVKRIDLKAQYELNAQTAYNRTSVFEANRCGCFHCGSTFDASEIRNWIKEPNGEDSALCPYCNVDAVIVGSESFPLSTALLSQLFMKWFAEEFKKSSSEANCAPLFQGEADFLRKGIPFQFSCDPAIKIVGVIDLFPLDWETEDLDDFDSIEAEDVQASECDEQFADEEGYESIVSAGAHFDESWYYCCEIKDSEGNRLPFDPWTGEMQDLLLDLTEQYGAKLRGLFKGPFSNQLHLFIRKDN